MLDEWEQRVRSVVGELVFGVDDDSMESVVLDLMRSKRLTLGLAESVTGGLVAARLTEVPGASDVLRGSIVSYAQRGQAFGCSTCRTGRWSARRRRSRWRKGARKVLDCDVALALTGVAGPTEQDGMPVGTLCVAIVWPDGELTRTLPTAGTASADAAVQRDQRPRSVAAHDRRRRRLGLGSVRALP